MVCVARMCQGESPSADALHAAWPVAAILPRSKVLTILCLWQHQWLLDVVVKTCWLFLPG